MTRTVVMAGLLLLLGACGNGNSNQNCDSTPGNIVGVCNIPNAGQCTDFSGLGNTDASAEERMCQGSWGGLFTCNTSGRIGTCVIPPDGQGTGIMCSSGATIEIRYYSSHYTLQTAQSQCAQVPGSSFTPG